jgi:hypothetical protein
MAQRGGEDSGMTSRPQAGVLIVVLLTLLLSSVAAARADAPVPSSGTGMLVLIDGCPGFVAAGGLAPNADPPFPLSWTHNFGADWTETDQLRFANDTTGQRTETAISLQAVGVDAAGHSFAITGKLYWHLFAGPEVWADSGAVRIRRDDGAVASGSAVGDGFPVFDPIFTVDRALVVTSTSCKLPN